MNTCLACADCDTRKIGLFSFIDAEDLNSLTENKIRTFYKKGQNIFFEGRLPEGIYCLNTGKIKIYKLGLDGKEQIVRFVLPGGLLGIRALLGGRSYQASATALENSTVCFIDKKNFFRLTLKYPAIAHQLMSTLSRLLEEAEQKLTSLAQKPVRERLAETLLILNKMFKPGIDNAENCSPVISLSREDLANIVGTATETVIRLLSEFKEDNLVKVNGRKIELKDLDGLKRIARVYD